MRFTPIIVLRIAALSLCAATPLAAAPAAADVPATVLARDAAFWKAFNGCALDALPQFLTADVEFYHDRGGVTLGVDAVLGDIKKNLCSGTGFAMRREALADTLHVYPLEKDRVVYGAVMSGEHIFYIHDKNKLEVLDGQARFTHLWLLRDGVWKMARILSYDHGPARAKR